MRQACFDDFYRFIRLLKGSVVIRRISGLLLAISFAVSSFSVDAYAGEYSELDAEEAIEETAEEDVDIETPEEDFVSEDEIEVAPDPVSSEFYESSESSEPFEHFASLDGYSISLSADPGVFPDDTETNIRIISETDSGKDIVFDAQEFSPYSVVLTASKASYYTIHFDGNNCTIGSMEDMDECKVGTEYVLTRNSFSRDYSIFTGWNTRADGTGTAYADCATVKNLSATDGDTVTLYAQWEFIPEDCNHYGRFGEESFSPKYVITKEATSTQWGEAQEICEICGEVLDTVEIHPYETYTINYATADPVTVTGWFDYDYAREVFDITNEYRREKGLNTLVYNDGCQDASDIRALEVSTYFSHTRPDGRKWNTVSENWKYAGENIAYGQKNPGAVMTAWKKSPGHNANLLYGIEDGDTPYQGLSVGCFHCISFDPETGEPAETISWGQQFTFDGIENVDPAETCIISQPENTIASVGETVTFNVVAQNVSEYKWYYSPNGYPWTAAENSSDMTGSDTDTLSVTVESSEFYNYRFKCVIWDNNSQQFTTDFVHIDDPDKIKTYIIRFVENDGTAYPDTTDMTCIIGQSFTLEANFFTRDGFIFNGWNTKPDGTGTYYADQALVKDLTTKDQGLVILYAQWANDSYRIQYFGNGSNGGYMDDWIERNYGMTYTLDANAYTRNGYHFTGWNTRADGRGTSYADRGQINLSFVPDGNSSSNIFKLYAQWKKDRYTITYNLNGGTNSEENPSSYSVTSATITLADPTRDNYTFGGWFSDSGFSTRVKTIGYGSTGNKIFYAKWNAITYNVKFYGDEETSGSMSDMFDCEVGKIYTLTANAFSKDGYHFTGWNTRIDGKGTAYADKAEVRDLSTTNNDTVILYAQWTKNETTKSDDDNSTPTNDTPTTGGSENVHGEDAVATAMMYRLYNPNSGEHFYTGSIEERTNLVNAGWIFEGNGWEAPLEGGYPVYRLYNLNAGDHHYTTSAEEKNDLIAVGWQYEGIAWNSASPDNAPLYRLYNPNAQSGSHHYTMSGEERDNLVSVGWRYEGIGWFGL